MIVFLFQAQRLDTTAGSPTDSCLDPVCSVLLGKSTWLCCEFQVFFPRHSDAYPSQLH